MKKLLTAFSLALCVTLAGCSSTDVQASADSSGEMMSESEMGCCAKAVVAEKSDCSDCGADVSGKQVCPATGAMSDKE
ncbi:MAG: hypothetical protein ACI9EF_000782 [Pseudohongiellaceae bacterium]|jgi:hypothetical protein